MSTYKPRHFKESWPQVAFRKNSIKFSPRLHAPRFYMLRRENFLSSNNDLLPSLTVYLFPENGNIGHMKS
jgi:hypothetical protein